MTTPKSGSYVVYGQHFPQYTIDAQEMLKDEFRDPESLNDKVLVSKTAIVAAYDEAVLTAYDQAINIAAAHNCVEVARVILERKIEYVKQAKETQENLKVLWADERKRIHPRRVRATKVVEPIAPIAVNAGEGALRIRLKE